MKKFIVLLVISACLISDVSVQKKKKKKDPGQWYTFVEPTPAQNETANNETVVPEQNATADNEIEALEQNTPADNETKTTEQNAPADKETENASEVIETAVSENPPAVTNASSGDGVPDLVFAFMVFRNGDRNPSYNALHDLNMIYEQGLKELVEKFGYEEMTHAGLNTSYKTGEFIRKRYEDLLTPKFNDSEVYIQSIDSTRAKLSVLVAMAAVYPYPVTNDKATRTSSSSSWNEDINWIPVPYTSDLLESDNILGTYHSCERLGLLIEQKRDEYVPLTKDQGPAANELAGVLNVPYHKLKLNYIMDSWEAISGLISLGHNISETMLQVFENSTSIYDAAWRFLFNNDDLVQMASGYLLNEFVEHADKIVSGKSTHKLRIYSAHDVNVYSFQAATNVTPQGRPKFGSLYSLELRRFGGDYFVLPVYLDDPHAGEETYLEVQGCAPLCNYELFKNLTMRFRIISKWKAEDHCEQGLAQIETEEYI
ncbi:lysosomal acid phosphatase-like precursor [Phthorimaea operculella]|nr:lysosomal acid phosphatase-like precursor [Phthorimaea operculella]